MTFKRPGDFLGQGDGVDMEPFLQTLAHDT